MAKEDPRRSRDAAGVGPYARERAGLVPLSQMKGWNVLDGEADIRSWEVRTVSGKVLGHVRDLLVDAKAGEVVLIDVDLAGSDRRAYVPIRVVEVDRARRVVRADTADLQEQTTASEVRLSSDELAKVRKDVRYADRSGERVVDRKPIVEETVVRRRLVDEPDTRP
jgi:hypothetical protein